MRAVIVILFLIATFIATSNLWSSVKVAKLPDFLLAAHVESPSEIFNTKELQASQPLWNWLFAKELIKRQINNAPLVKQVNIENCDSWSCFELKTEYLEPAYLLISEQSKWLLSQNAEFIAPMEGYLEENKSYSKLTQIKPSNQRDANLVNLQVKSSITFIRNLEAEELKPESLDWHAASVNLKLKNWSVIFLLPSNLSGEDKNSFQETLVTRIIKLKKHYEAQQEVASVDEDLVQDLPEPVSIDLRFKDQAVISFKS